MTVVEQRAAAGRARLPAARRAASPGTPGPSLLTMPWVLEETFAAGGLDLHSEVDAAPARPAVPDPLGRRGARTSTSPPTRDAAARRGGEVLRRATPRASSRSWRRCGRSTSRAILGAGRRPFLAARDFARLVPDDGAARRAAAAARASSRATSSTRACARRSPSTRCSSAATRTACRRSTPRSSTCRCSTAAGTPTAGVYALVEAMARPLDVRCGEPVERIEHAGGRVTGVRLAGGERIAADVVVSNADVLRTHELLGPPAAAAAAARDDVVLPALPRHGPAVRAAAAPHAAGRRRLPRVHPRASRAGASCRAPSPPTSTRRRAPSRRWRAAGGDSLAVLLPGARTCARGSTGTREGDRLRDALLADLEATLRARPGCATPIVVEHRMTPLDFARELGAVWGNAFAVEPTLHQSAYFRPPNRDRRLGRALLRRRRDASRRRRPGRAAGRRGHRRAGRRATTALRAARAARRAAA